jgi:hypothetical protein
MQNNQNLNSNRKPKLARTPIQSVTGVQWYKPNEVNQVGRMGIFEPSKLSRANAVRKLNSQPVKLLERSTIKSNIKNLLQYYKFLEFSIGKIREALNGEYNSNSKKIINDTYMMIERNEYKVNISTFNNNLIKILKNISPELYGCFIYLIYYELSYKNRNYVNKKNEQESIILKELIDLGKNIESVNINYKPMSTQNRVNAGLPGLERTNTPLPYVGTTTQSYFNAVTKKFKFIEEIKIKLDNLLFKNKYPNGRNFSTKPNPNLNPYIHPPYTSSKLIEILTNISPELYGEIIYKNLYYKSMNYKSSMINYIDN